MVMRAAPGISILSAAVIGLCYVLMTIFYRGPRFDPDLLQEGGERPNDWHLAHFHDHVRIGHRPFDGAATAVKGMLRPDLSRPGLGLEFKERNARSCRRTTHRPNSRQAENALLTTIAFGAE
jgi:hypothetical protein